MSSRRNKEWEDHDYQEAGGYGYRHKGLHPVNQDEAEQYPAADIPDAVRDIEFTGREMGIALIQHL